jgi:hypothetical protein
MNKNSTHAPDLQLLIGLSIFKDLQVGEMIAESNQGAVFDLIYSGSKNQLMKSLVCKFTTSHDSLEKEVKIIKAARKISKKGLTQTKLDGPIPKIVNNGIVELEISDKGKTKLSFMIMKKYDLQLVDYLMLNNISL